MSGELAVDGPATTNQGRLMKPIASPKELIIYHDEMAKIIKDALKEGVDYGTIPGTKKPTLYKAGAERINIAFGTHPEYYLIEKEADHDRENKYKDRYNKECLSYGLYRYIYKCKIIRNTDGATIGEGEGVCSTLEAKYIQRPRDSENTALKMAQKRAFLAATLHTFGLSDRFTQDMEDFHHQEEQTSKAAESSRPVVTEPFNLNNFKLMEKLDKNLTALKIPAEQHLAIASELQGKPLNKTTLTDAIAKIGSLFVQPKEENI